MKKIQVFLFILVLAAASGTGTAAFWHWIKKPYILRADIRGKGVDVEWIKQQEEKQRNGAKGILRIAGWQIQKEEPVFSESTGREAKAQVIGVYGAMELVEDVKMRCGNFGLAVEGEYCVLSEKLARELFGGTDIVGEQILVGKKRLWVAGVTKKEATLLWLPIEKGELEMLALEVDGRLRESVNIEELFK